MQSSKAFRPPSAIGSPDEIATRGVPNNKRHSGSTHRTAQQHHQGCGDDRTPSQKPLHPYPPHRRPCDPRVAPRLWRSPENPTGHQQILSTAPRCTVLIDEMRARASRARVHSEPARSVLTPSRHEMPNPERSPAPSRADRIRSVRNRTPGGKNLPARVGAVESGDVNRYRAAACRSKKKSV